MLSSWRPWLFVFIAGFGLSVGAARARARPLALEDEFQLATAGDAQISPDGRWIAFLRYSSELHTDSKLSKIWLIDTASGVMSPIGSLGGWESSPRWASDGRHLAYTDTLNDVTQLDVFDVEAKSSKTLASSEDGIEDISWSLDADRIAYVARVLIDPPFSLGHRLTMPQAHWASPLRYSTALKFREGSSPKASELFVVPSHGGPSTQLTHDHRFYFGPLSWTKDREHLLLTATDLNEEAFDPTHPVRTQIYSLAVSSGEKRPLTNRAGSDYGPRVSPDGSKIAFLGFDDDGRAHNNAHAYVMNLDGSHMRALSNSLDRHISTLQWASPDSLLVSYSDQSFQRLARLDLAGHLAVLPPTLVDADPNRPASGDSFGTFSVSRGGDIAYTGGDASSPADVYLARSTGETRRLTRLSGDLLRQITLGRVNRIVAKAHDGTSIEAWIVTPPGYKPGKRLPLILNIHGGILYAFGPMFSFEMQAYASAGYAVLYPNPRGSTGYGQRFGDALPRGDVDEACNDLLAAVDAAIDAGIADPNNLFVTGMSWGGVEAAWLIGKTDRFKAAAPTHLLASWGSWALLNDDPDRYWRAWLRSPRPWEDPLGYWTRSPLSQVGRISTPTLLLVGELDTVAVPSEAEQLYTALKMRHVPSALGIIPGAAHSYGTISQHGEAIAAILDWFGRYRTVSE